MFDDNINPYASPSEMGSDVVPQEVRVATQTATIVPVPEPYCGRVVTNGHVVGLAAVYLAVMVPCSILGTIGLITLGTGLSYEWQKDILPLIFAATCITISLLATGWLVPIAESIYWRWLLRRTFRKRPDLLVSENDPDFMIVNMMPRMSWRSMLWADIPKIRDIGLLKLDAKRSEVLIESDRERFRIPYGSILECEPDVFHKQPGTTARIGFVRLVVQLQDGTREIRFCPIYNGFKFRTDNDKRLMAIDICQRINSLAMPIA